MRGDEVGGGGDHVWRLVERGEVQSRIASPAWQFLLRRMQRSMPCWELLWPLFMFTQQRGKE